MFYLCLDAQIENGVTTRDYNIIEKTVAITQKRLGNSFIHKKFLLTLPFENILID